MLKLNIENLSHRYGPHWAIKDINLTIDRPGIFGLLGANGAGKTTLMNIICGTLIQTKGDVWINGCNIRKNPLLAKRDIGYLPQQLPLYEDLTVNEYLRYTAELRFLDNKNIYSAIEEIKEKCQILHMSNRLIKNLSGGYKQRVAIAQALIHKPKFVVMDEPTNGLDPNQLIEVRRLIKEIGETQTVFFSSHIMNEIQEVCDDIIMIEKGRIVFSDSIQAFHNYSSSNSLLITFNNPPKIKDLIQAIGISDLEQLSTFQFRVSITENSELSERIIEESVKNGWKLKEITMEKSALDEIFNILSANENN